MMRSLLAYLQQPANLVVLQALGKLLLISAFGYLAVRCRLISARTTECLSGFVIAIALPCLIISSLSASLNYELLDEMGLCVIAAFALNGLGLAVALAAARLFLPPPRPGRRLFVSLAALQNSGYLPIPLALAILPAAQQAAGLLFVFVYMLVMGLVFWSLGVWLIGRRSAGPEMAVNPRRLLNPPIIALLAGLLFLIAPLKAAYHALPLLQEGVTTVGNTTIPLVLIVLGGSFAAIAGQRSDRRLLGLAAGLKLVVIPALAMLAAKLLELDRMLAFVLVLQAAMPAAMNHIVVAQKYGGDVALTSQALFGQYLLSIITVPFFLLLFNSLF